MFQLFPTDYRHKVVGVSSVCVLTRLSLRRTNNSPATPTNTVIIGEAYKENLQPNCQSGLAIVNQFYREVEDLW